MQKNVIPEVVCLTEYSLTQQMMCVVLILATIKGLGENTDKGCEIIAI